MTKDRIAGRLMAIAGKTAVLKNEPMARHTTFRIGGPADWFVCPDSREKLIDVIAFCRNESLPCCVIGNGSNLLVGDNGFRGVIVEVGRGLSCVTMTEDGRINSEAGVLLAALAHRAAESGLTGLEFASGIPGSLGGAVYMNAGAYGGEMKQVVRCAEVLTGSGQIEVWENDKLDFGYRRSRVSDEGAVVLSVELILKKGDPEAIRQTIDDLRQRRQTKQPLEYPSAGSTFKRPEGNFAGKLIMEAGLAGYTVGGAQVSEKHCGFVINTGGATASDVRQVIDHVTECVEAASGVRLEPEVRLIGEF